MAEKLTKAQRSDLELAAENPLGVIDVGYNWNGLARASWHAKMSRLVSAGLLKPYAHGGYEITPAGRTALQDQEAGDEKR